MRELVMGLVVGVLVGFMIWGGVREPSGGVAPEATPAAGGTPVEPVRRAPTLEAPPMPAGPAAVSATTAPEDKAPADRSAVFRGASRAELDAAFVQHKRLSDAEAAALIVRTEEAQRRKDLRSFLRLLRILGESGHPLAHAHLVALVADVEADYPELFAQTVQPFLLVTEAPGVVAAAKARSEVGPRGEAGPWVEVVVERGTDADVEALLGRGDRHHPSAIYQQLMSRPLEEARSYLDRAESHGPPFVNFLSLLHRFAEAHPAEGKALILEGILALDDGAELWRTLTAAGYGGPLINMYVSGVDVDDWPATAAILSGLRNEQMRLAALEALGPSVSTRALDASLLRDLLEQPAHSIREILDAKPVPQDAWDRLRRVAYMLSNNRHFRLCVTEKNVAAVEYAATHWQGEHKDELQRHARNLRAALEDDGWR